MRPRAASDRRIDFRFLRDCYGHGSSPGTQTTLHLALRIMGRLAGAGLGEVDAIAGAQAPYLTFNIRAGLSIAALLVDEAIPYIDIDDARLIGPAAIQLVKKWDVGGRLLPTQRRQSHPEQ